MNLPNIVHNQHNPHNGRPLSQQFPPAYHPSQPLQYAPQSSHRYSTPNPPALPLSPQVDSSKCSLPSISTLLVYADGAQPNGSLERSHSLSSGRSIPPSPPIRGDYYDVAGNSPTLSTCSSGTLSSGPGHFYSSSAPPSNRNSFPPAQKPPYPHNEPGYVPYYGPPNGVSQAPTSSHPWTHHHHSSPASHAAFPQSQDRYICQTCSKAFSRPSSLRIHSHSHTGEKPFKCPHLGCGKAFSVRSNMKRHERGCHLD